jgi:predicted AAA+ superfamily ATPase
VEYQPRTVDNLLKELVGGLPAVCVEGAKGVGKTASAGRLAASTLELDLGGLRENVAADPRIIATMPPPTLIDEWQLVPAVWDVVRREVDRDRAPGRFLLTGSATPSEDARIHSGAGRIVRLLMRPMTLPERGVAKPAVSFATLLAGSHPDDTAATDLVLADYVREIIASGFPGVRQDPARLRARQLDSYLDSALERDIPGMGVSVRRPQALRAWLTAYAAATGTTANYTTILDAATPGDADKPARATAMVYRELLERIHILEPLPAWAPTLNPLTRLGMAPKHYLVDPGLAARLLGATEESLVVDTVATAMPREGTLLGVLFESLVVLTVRVFAECLGARVSHLRTRNGDHEIDIIVERDDHRVLAIEVKLSAVVNGHDTRHLAWLETLIGDQLVDKVVVNTGPFAHRLPDGTAVVPLGLLGP